MSSPYNTRRKRKTAGAADPEWNPPAAKRSSHSVNMSAAHTGPAAGSGCSAPSTSSGLKGTQRKNAGGGRSDGGKQKQPDMDVATVSQGFEEDAASEATDSDFGEFDDEGSVVWVGERYPRLAVDPVVKEEPEDDPMTGPAGGAVNAVANDDRENEDFLPPGIVITEILARELQLYFFEQRNKPTFFDDFSQDDLNKMPVRMPVPLLHIPY